MDLTTKYLGLQLSNPIVTGSSPMVDDLDQARRLEDAGAAALVVRSLFEEQVVAEEMAFHAATEPYTHASAEASSYFADVDAFVFGSEKYLDHLRALKAAVAVPVIASLNGSNLDRCISYAKKIQEAGADALELNLYYLATDPARSSQELEDHSVQVVEGITQALTIPVSVKLSPFYTSLPHFARRLVAAGARGLVLFNRFYQPDIDVEQLEVDRKIALSESSDLLLRLRWLAILHGQVETSLAVSGGVHNSRDALKAIMAGADAVQVVSAVLKQGPAQVTRIRNGLSQWLDEHDYESLGQARGSMSLTRVPDPAGYERVNYAEVLKSWGRGW